MAALSVSTGLLVYRYSRNLVLTIGYFWHILRFAVYISPKLRCWILLSRRLAKTKRVYHGVQNLTVRYFASISPDVILQYMNWFWLYQIKNNTDDAIFDDILNCLFDISDKRILERYLFLSFKTDVNFWEHVIALLAYSGPLQSWARMTLSRLMQSSARKGFSLLLTQLVFSWCFWLNYHITFNAFQVWWYPNSTQSVQWRSCHVRKVAKVKDSVAKDQGQEREEA